MDTHSKRLVAILVYVSAFAWHAGAAQPPLPSQQPQASPQASLLPAQPTIHVEVNSILVPVVVRDASGKSVDNLRKEDFKVLDQGKPRPVIGFSLETSSGTRATQSASTSLALPNPTPNTPTSTAVPPSPVAPKRFILFLFDDRHLGPSEIDQVKQAGIRMLDQPLADTDRAIVLSFLGVNSGITRDPAVLKAAVQKLKTQETFRHDSHQCPDIDYYAADQILNKHSSTEYQIASERATICTHMSDASLKTANATVELNNQVLTAAQRTLQIGEEDTIASLSYLRNVIHTMSTLPGQRTLILISPGFLALSQEAMNLETQVLNVAAASSVTVNTLDARGLYGSAMISASQSGSGSLTGLQTGQIQQDNSDSMRANTEEMADLADGTGGTFFHNNNDLESGFRSLMAAPETLYLLEVSLQGIKPNGTYHSLKVETDQSGLKVQARKGYFAPLPPKSGK
jgi:VWFA-related protein